MNHFTKLGKLLEVYNPLNWIGWCPRRKHRIPNAIRPLLDRRTHSRKPKILLPLHPEVPSHSLQDRLPTAREVAKTQGHSRHPLGHLREFQPTRKISEQVHPTCHSEVLSPGKLRFDRGALHPQGLQQGHLQFGLKGTGVFDAVIPEIQAFGDPSSVCGQAASWASIGEDEAGDGRNEEPVGGLPDDLGDILITHKSIRQLHIISVLK